MSLVPLLVAAAGGALVFFLLRRRGWEPWPSAALGLVLGPGVGLGLHSLAFFFWVFFGNRPPDRWLLIGLVGLLAVPLYVSRRPERVPGAGRSRPFADARIPLAVVLILVTVSLGLLLTSFPRICDCRPYGQWDATAIWNLRALLLFRADGDLQSIFSQLQAGPSDYPLLLPTALAAQYALLGREDLAIPQTTALLFVLSLGAAVFCFVARVSSRAVAGLATALLWATPELWIIGFAQYADIVLAYLLTGAALVLASQLEASEARRIPPILGGFFLGLLAWVKNEGLVLASILTVVFVVALLKERGAEKRRWSAGARIAAGALPGLAALVLFRAYWPGTSEFDRFLTGVAGKLTDLERWSTVARGFWAELSPVSGHPEWGIVWPFLGLAAFLFRRNRAARGSAYLAGGTFFLGGAAFFSVFLLSYATDLEWHLRTALDRLLFQILPLALVGTLSGIGRGGEPEGSPTRPRPSWPRPRSPDPATEGSGRSAEGAAPSSRTA